MDQGQGKSTSSSSRPFYRYTNTSGRLKVLKLYPGRHWISSIDTWTQGDKADVLDAVDGLMSSLEAQVIVVRDGEDWFRVVKGG